MLVERGGKTTFDQNVLFHQSFGFAKQGEPILYNNEMMKLALAVSCGSFERKNALGIGADRCAPITNAKRAHQWIVGHLIRLSWLDKSYTICLI